MLISELECEVCRTMPVVEPRAKRDASGQGRMQNPGTLSFSNASCVYKACSGNGKDEGVEGGISSRGEVLAEILIFSRE